MKQLIKKASFWRRFAMIVMLIMIMIRPSFSTESSIRQNLNLNIWFVVDATSSMVAKDVDGGATRRFEKIQSDIEAVVRGVPGAKYGMLVQDYYSYVASPLSFDSEAIISSLGYVKPKDYSHAQPTNLSDLLQFAEETISKYQVRYPERVNAIVFMSDGEDYSKKQSAYESKGASGQSTATNLGVSPEFANSIKSAYVLGYGSANGSPVEKVGIIGESFDSDDYDPSAIDSENYIKYFYKDGIIETDSENRVISKINNNNLTTIANSLNGEYYHRESGDLPNDIAKKFHSIASVIETETPSSINSRAETYWIFAIVLLGLILWEGAEILNRLLLEKEVKNA